MSAKNPLGSTWAAELKGEPSFVLEDEHYFAPLALSEADVLNGKDPQPVEWVGNVTATFPAGRKYTPYAMGTGSTRTHIERWEDNIEVCVCVAKKKGKWQLLGGDRSKLRPAFYCGEVGFSPLSCEMASKLFGRGAGERGGSPQVATNTTAAVREPSGETTGGSAKNESFTQINGVSLTSGNGGEVGDLSIWIYAAVAIGIGYTLFMIARRFVWP